MSMEDEIPCVYCNGTVLNVYSGELLRADVVVKGERFYYVGPSTPLADNCRKVDLTGKYLVPGYIDPHFHPWFIYNPLTFGGSACRYGITTLFCDNLLFYMLMGPELFEKFMNELKYMPIKYYWFCRAVPQTPMEHEENLFSFDNLVKLLQNPLAQSVGEITRWPELVRGNKGIEELINYVKRKLRKRVDGHTAGAKYDQLVVLSRKGIESCHEAINAQEALDRLRLGMYVILRESSLRQDLGDLLRIITESKVMTDRIMLTSDCSAPAFYDEFGITDHILKIPIDMGIDPVLVYRMVTINPAVYFGLDHEIGGIAPGRFGDFVVLDDLRNPVPEMVVSKGRIIVSNRKQVKAFPQVNWGEFFPPDSFTKRTWTARKDFFQISCKGSSIHFPVITLTNAVITRLEWKDFRVNNGLLDISSEQEYSFIALLDKEGQWITKGIIKGFGSIDGFASSFNTAAQILVIGRSSGSMAAAVNRVLEMRGGVVAVEKEQITYELPLPLGGIMSDRPIGELARKENELKTLLNRNGYSFHDPFYTLVFLPNDFLPEVRINYRGIINIKTNEVLYPRMSLNES